MKFILQALAELRADLEPLLISRCAFLLKTQPLTKKEKEISEQKNQPVLVKLNGKYSIFGLTKNIIGNYVWSETQLSSLSREEGEKLDQLFTKYRAPHVIQKGSIDDYLLLRILNKGHIDNTIEMAEKKRKEKEEAALKNLEQKANEEQKEDKEQKESLREKKKDSELEDAGGVVSTSPEEKECDFPEDEALTASQLLSWLAFRLRPILDSYAILALVFRIYMLSNDENLKKIADLSLLVKTPKKKIFMQIMDRFLKKLASNSDKVISEIDGFLSYFKVISIIKMAIKVQNWLNPKSQSISTSDTGYPLLDIAALQKKGEVYTKAARAAEKEARQNKQPPEQKPDSLAWFARYKKYYPDWLVELLDLFLPEKPSITAAFAPISLLIQSFICQANGLLLEPRFIGEAVERCAAMLKQEKNKQVRFCLERLAKVLKKDPINSDVLIEALKQALPLVFPNTHKTIHSLLVSFVKAEFSEQQLLTIVLPCLLMNKKYESFSDLLLLKYIRKSTNIIESAWGDDRHHRFFTLNEEAARSLFDSATAVRLNSLLSRFTDGRALNDQINEQLRALLTEKDFIFGFARSLQELLALFLREGETWALGRFLEDVIGVSLGVGLKSFMGEEKTTPHPQPSGVSKCSPAREKSLDGQVLREVFASGFEECNLLVQENSPNDFQKRAARKAKTPILFCDYQGTTKSYYIYGLKDRWDQIPLSDLSKEESDCLEKLYLEKEKGKKTEPQRLIARAKMDPLLLKILEKGHAPSVEVKDLPEVLIGLFLNLISTKQGKSKVIELLSWIFNEVLTFLRSFLKKETYQYYEKWKDAELKEMSDFLTSQPSFEWKEEKAPKTGDEHYFRERIEDLEEELQRLEGVSSRLLEFKKHAEAYPMDPEFASVKESLSFAHEEAIQVNQGRIKAIQALIKAKKLQALRCSGNIEGLKEDLIKLTEQKVKVERSLRKLEDECKSFDRAERTRTQAKRKELQSQMEEGTKHYQQLVDQESRSIKALLERIQESVGRIEIQLETMGEDVREWTWVLQKAHADLLTGDFLGAESREVKEVKGAVEKPPVQDARKALAGLLIEDPLRGKGYPMKEIEKPRRQDVRRAGAGLLPPNFPRLENCEVKEIKTAIDTPSLLEKTQKKTDNWLQVILCLETELKDLEKSVVKYLRAENNLIRKLRQLQSLAARYKLRLLPPPLQPTVKASPRCASPLLTPTLFEVKKELEGQCDQRLQTGERKRRCAELEVKINTLVTEHCVARKSRGFLSYFHKVADDGPWRAYLDAQLLPELRNYASTGKSDGLLLALYEGLYKHGFELYVPHHQRNESNARDPRALLNLLNNIPNDLKLKPVVALPLKSDSQPRGW